MILAIINKIKKIKISKKNNKIHINLLLLICIILNLTLHLCNKINKVHRQTNLLICNLSNYNNRSNIYNINRNNRISNCNNHSRICISKYRNNRLYKLTKLIILIFKISLSHL